MPLRLRSLAAPAVALGSVHALWRPDDALLWDPPAGPGAVAVGVAVRLKARGEERFASILADAALHWRRFETRPDIGAPTPRFWGGFAFAPGAADAEPWQAFGDADFVLPRLAYWREGDRAWLQAIGPHDDTALDDELALAARSLEHLASQVSEAHASTDVVTGTTGRVEPADAGAWQRQIDDILAAIDSGRVRKVVAALCARATFDHPASVDRILSNLRQETLAWRFAFGRGRASFVGATPELLVRRRGDVVECDALAGTLAKADGSAADLLASAKDQGEHRFVRDAIAAILAPLCSDLTVPEAPGVRELRRLYHLATPIRGTLRSGRHVLDLCARLHPTPATCGTPRDLAWQMIVSAEQSPRGWYASPVGWFDAAGDGEFVVGLRSGLVTGHQAWVYAGAGIVKGSDAGRELAEVQLKQRVMLRALGLEH